MKRYIVILLFYINLLPAQQHFNSIKFKNYTIKDGLSSSVVTCICQDNRGFMWLGTRDGLNRFDGFEFTIYRNNPNDLSSISGNTILDILNDKNGNLWIATRAGLDLYDVGTDSFIHFHIRDEMETYITDILELPSHDILISSVDRIYKVNMSNKSCEEYISEKLRKKDIHFKLISKIIIDSQNILWIAEKGKNGLIAYDLKNDKIFHYNHTIQNDKGLLSNSVYSLMEDNLGNIWIGTKEGLNIYDPKTNRFISFVHIPNDSSSLSGNMCNALFQDSKEQIWVGTYQSGLNLYLNKPKKFTHLQHDKFDESSLNHNSIRSIFEDSNGILWIGTTKGVSLSQIKPSYFKTFRNIQGNSNTLSYNFVSAFAEDVGGNVWIGTDGGGLNYFDRHTGVFNQNQFDKSGAIIKLPQSISAILRDSKNNLWLGASTGGLIWINSDLSRSVCFKYNPNNANSLSNDDIRYIFEDSSGNIWIATDGGGLNLLVDFKRKWFKRFSFNNENIKNSLVNNACTAITEDSYGNIWIATYHGLSMLNPTNDTFKNFYSYDSCGLGDNWIFTLHEDSQKRLWVGTSKGLHLLQRENWIFKKIETNNSLTSGVINGILEDDKGVLWLSTNRGLVSYNPRNALVKNYTLQDGLQSDEFLINSCLRLSSGEMLFGGINGFTLFHPDSIRDSSDFPEIIITGLKFLNKKIFVNGTDSPLERPIGETSLITLTHKQAVLFSFEYSALEYLFPEKIQYKYQLQNYHNDWIYVGKNRSAAFTNLDAGNYVFRVVSTNSVGAWNKKGAGIRVHILPPIWQTWQAYLLYFILVMLSLVFYHRYSMKLMTLKTDLRLQRIEKEKAYELSNLKAQFFTNISHEFRTPLTLILTPLKDLLLNGEKKDWSYLKGQFHIMRRSAERLLRLVNQVIDFNKIDAGKLTLNKRNVDIIEFTKTIVDSFKSLATDKHIILTFTSSSDACFAIIDPDQFDLVIFNLLSNAFKFTPPKGEISASVKRTNGLIKIAIMDSGPGIPDEHLEYIFNRFYHVENPAIESGQGAGIGLSLSKELVELHGGSITVRNLPKGGACFMVQIPAADVVRHQKFIPEAKNNQEQSEQNNRTESTNNPPDTATILIVEDDRELRHYLKYELGVQYAIAEAINGRQGLEQAATLMPDLIVSDVMMREMDGIELCKKLKTNELTSHIPIILLTARTSERQQLEGLETGADDYVTKPFNLQNLKTRIYNLLESRRIMRERFSRQIRVKPKDIVINSVDEQFLKRAIEIVESNISNSDFSIEQFGKMLGLSRTQLFRKINGLLSETPMQFIQTIRLKRGAQLLIKSELSIMEICYEVGFNSPSHFAKLFHSKFGMTPKAFRKNPPLDN